MDEATMSPLGIPRSQGAVCHVEAGGHATCGVREESKEVVVASVSCPQLPPTSPSQLARGTWSKPPVGWTCPPELYYQLDCPFVINVTCDCGCGIIDPDCGFEITDCEHQKWEPKYERLKCNGVQQDMGLYYCRLESASCQALPPGLAKGATSTWTCIPDVYKYVAM